MNETESGVAMMAELKSILASEDYRSGLRSFILAYPIEGYSSDPGALYAIATAYFHLDEEAGARQVYSLLTSNPWYVYGAKSAMRVHTMSKQRERAKIERVIDPPMDRSSTEEFLATIEAIKGSEVMFRPEIVENTVRVINRMWSIAKRFSSSGIPEGVQIALLDVSYKAAAKALEDSVSMGHSAVSEVMSLSHTLKNSELTGADRKSRLEELLQQASRRADVSKDDGPG